MPPGSDGASQPQGLDFYIRAVEDGEALYEAAAIEGIDAEIALLRLELRQYAKTEAHKLDVLQRSIGQLVRAVVARHRMSPQSADELERTLAEVLARFGGDLAVTGTV